MSGPWSYHDRRRRRADRLGKPALFFDKGQWTWLGCNAIDNPVLTQRNRAAKGWTEAQR